MIARPNDFSPKTASAWVLVSDYFPFMVGPDQTGKQLGVIRLGGHLEQGESPWQCAVREVKEEANLDIEYLKPPATYQAAGDEFRPLSWDDSDSDSIQPILVGSHSHYFLAHSRGYPTPCNEAWGLLLLGHEEVVKLTQYPMSLGTFLENGGRAIFRDAEQSLPKDMLLNPKGPRLLANALTLHPRLGL